MTNQEREELLSAYLDGEVSPDERARVDAWLAESPELRQLHDELLATRAGFKSLPRYKLDHDLGSAVLKRSQRPAPRSSEAPSGGGSIIPSTLAEWWSRGLGTRRLLWPALAVAAALIILVYDASQRPGEQQVAQAPASSSLEPSDAAVAARRSEIGAYPEEPAETLSKESDVARAAEGAAAPPLAGAPLAAPQATDSARSAPAPSAGFAAPMSKSNSQLMRSAAKAGGAAGRQPIVIQVSPEYLQQRRFEKLLDSHQLGWKVLPLPAQKSAKPLAQDANGAAPVVPAEPTSGERAVYFVRASDEQIRGILAAEPQLEKLVRSSERSVPLYADQQSRREAANGIEVMLIAPVEPQPGTPPATR
jgi:hypothetical protein